MLFIPFHYNSPTRLQRSSGWHLNSRVIPHPLQTDTHGWWCWHYGSASACQGPMQWCRVAWRANSHPSPHLTGEAWWVRWGWEGCGGGGRGAAAMVGTNANLCKPTNMPSISSPELIWSCNRKINKREIYRPLVERYRGCCLINVSYYRTWVPAEASVDFLGGDS